MNVSERQGDASHLVSHVTVSAPNAPCTKTQDSVKVGHHGEPCARPRRAAIQLAAGIPPARHGSIEVRPVRELQVQAGT